MSLDNFGNLGVRRCREHTEALVEALELGVLWDEYGLVGDVVVSRSSANHLWTNKLGTSTSFSPSMTL